MSPQILLLLLSGTVFAALGQILFKFGATGRESLISFINPAILTGLTCYGLGTIAWIYSLSKAPLTLVYPFTALTFALVYLAGIFIFGEPTSLRSYIGISLILVGLYLITVT